MPAEPVSPDRPLLVGAAFALSLLVMLAASVLRRLEGVAAVAAPADLPMVDEVEMPAVAEPEPQPEPVCASWSRSDAVRAVRDAEAAPLQIEPIPATLVMRRSSPRFAPEAPPAPVRRTIGEVDVAMAAERLIAGGAMRAIFVSPEGDEGAAASVLVARDVADAGLRVVLLDLTASGAASRPMLEGTVYTGITNLLVSEAQFGDVIHNDLYSGCHVIPVGTADPVRAMRAAERLPIILDSLTTAYDLVVVECGATDAEGIRRLVVDDTSVLLAAIEPSDEIAEVALELDRQGLGRPIIVSPGEAAPPRRPDRSAA
jgi:Mrp family chromosome partitioning ATPase